jgi:hypothetical protein
MLMFVCLLGFNSLLDASVEWAEWRHCEVLRELDAGSAMILSQMRRQENREHTYGDYIKGNELWRGGGAFSNRGESEMKVYISFG